MKHAPSTALALLLAGALAAIHPLARGAPADALNQIRLDQPAGGGGGGGKGTAPPTPAPASGLVMDVSVEDTLRIMRALKYTSVSIEKPKEGGPFIKAVIGDQPTYVWHANCTENRCRALHFAAYLGRQDSVDDAFIHDYNRNTMFTKMAKDKDGELQLTMGISLVRGVSEEHVRAMCDSWMVYFREALEYKPEGR